jgi:hypothetical protein
MRKKTFIFFFFSVLILISSPDPVSPKNPVEPQEGRASTETETTLLRLMGIIPSPGSINFVQEKTQAQLHTLVTEQRHSRTWNLSGRISQDLEAGLRMILSVDEDISDRLRSLGQENDVLERAVQAVEGAILSGSKIYVFGCRETGRWAKWLEGSIWRPFWQNLKTEKKIWEKISSMVGESIENRLFGEMPGSDPSLIAPFVGWEDLMVTGRLQLAERGIEPGDVVFCVSASGESPAVIGTAYEALDRWTKRYPYEAEKIQKKLFFIFNNPEAALQSFDRSQAILEEPGISKINLTTGPQALAGSLRMQAATIDAFLIAQILQTALDRVLRPVLSKRDMAKLGFEAPVVFSENLGRFSDILREVKKVIPAIAKLTLFAEKAILQDGFTSYSGLKGLGTVFNDCAERGPAFHLQTLDTVKTLPRKSRIQVWAPRPTLEEAWTLILGRPFRGLSVPSYKNRFEQEITDTSLLRSLLQNLKNAEDDQQFLYDFSFSDFNLRNRGAGRKDLGVLVAVSPEETLLKNHQSYFRKFVDSHLRTGARTALLVITDRSEKEINRAIQKLKGFDPDKKDVLLVLPIESAHDPLLINKLTAVKIILNAHSSALMARSDRIIGNTNTLIDPNDPKSIDRGTATIQSHVNDVLKNPEWVKQHGILKPISYGEANAVLFDTIGSIRQNGGERERSFDLSPCIIRILESLRMKMGMGPEEALSISQDRGIRKYLNDVTTQIE